MNKFIRLMIMIILVLGIIFVAKSQIAGANPSAGPSLSSAHDQAQAVNADKNDDCKNNKDKCKGSVKPPPRSIHISATGNYSVGGFCTLSVVFNDPAISLDAAIQAPLPRELPDTVHRIRQGCLLTYYASGQRIDDLSATSGTSTICFAVIPNQQMVIYFYNLYALTPEWTALPTTVQNGVACALSVQSGVYVATFQKP